MNKKRPSHALLAIFVLGLAMQATAQNPIPPPPRVPASRNPAAASSSPSADSVATAAPTAAQNSSSASAAASSDYVLASADAVQMSVFHQPDLTTETKIANDGTAQFPLIGELKIGGLTLRDARELIRKRYNADYLVEPQVDLKLIGYAQRKFTVMGQVNTPGPYLMPGGEHLGLLEAIGMAGGFTRIADRGAVVITRNEHGTEKKYRVNTKKLTTQEGNKFELMPGDVITVNETWL